MNIAYSLFSSLSHREVAPLDKPPYFLSPKDVRHATSSPERIEDKVRNYMS